MSIQTEEIKSKLDILEILGEYITLKKSGSSFVALCPFHHEKTPSLHVSPDRQVWHCFGCSEGGDLFAFVMKMEAIEFKDALKMLAERAGVKLEENFKSNSSQEDILRQINLWTSKFFKAMLLQSDRANLTRDYVAKRGLTPETVEEFMIGYAPDSWDALPNFLRQKGFRDADLISAGVASKRDLASGIYARFRNRLMFTINDHLGRPIAFTGRILPTKDGSETKSAKYVNTSETLLYKKGSVLFGLDKARRAIKEADLAVLVEGQMDVISSHQAGVKNVVASSGTALSEAQLALLKRLTRHLILSFDADSAGVIAAERAIDLCLKDDFSIKMLTLPDGRGKDPDDCIRQDPQAWIEAIKNARPHMDWYIDLMQQRFNLHEADGKSQAGAILLKEAAKLNDPVARSHWLSRLSEVLATPVALLFEQVEKLRKTTAGLIGPFSKQPASGRVAQNKINTPAHPTRLQTILEHLVGLLINWPELNSELAWNLEESIEDVDLSCLYNLAKMHYRKLEQESLRQPFFAWLASSNLTPPANLARITLTAQRDYGSFSFDQRKKITQTLAAQLQKTLAARKRLELTQAMARAETSQDLAAISKINEELKQLKPT